MVLSREQKNAAKCGYTVVAEAAGESRQREVGLGAESVRRHRIVASHMYAIFSFNFCFTFIVNTSHERCIHYNC